MSKPLISVIVPIYHVEKYLNRCVDSIIGQTYTNLEIILVDDGSNDGCPAICDDYAKKDSRIRVIHKENGGLSDARNAGIKEARGEYLSFVDSDDYIHRDMYRILMDELQKADADVSICSYKYVYDGKPDETDERYESEYPVEVMDGIKAQHRYYNGDVKLELTVAWNKLYKKELFDNLCYPKGKIFEDEYTTYKALYRSNKVCYIDLPLYYYLQRSDSIIGKMAGVRTAGVIDAYLERLAFYKSSDEDELWTIEAMHVLHMMCYLTKLALDSKADTSGIMDGQHRRAYLLEIYSNRKAYRQMSLSKKAEVLLYRISGSVYYKIWKLFKGK